MKSLTVLILGLGMMTEAQTKQKFTDFPCSGIEGNSLDNEGHVGTLTMDAKSVCGITGGWNLKWTIDDLIVDSKHYSRCDAVKNGKRRCYLRRFEFENVGDGAQGGGVKEMDACADAHKRGDYCKVLATSGGWHTAMKPEPMDVPATEIPSAHNCFDGHSQKAAPCAGYTCADRRRVLLTSEDGAKHCILFPKEPQ